MKAPADSPAAQAAQSKAASMKQVDDAADAEWKEFILDIIWEIACVVEFFTTDQICIRYRNIPGPKPDTHNWKALGPRMQKAAKLKYIEKTGQFVKSTDGTRRHGAPLQVWRSLVVNGKKHASEI